MQRVILIALLLLWAGSAVAQEHQWKDGDRATIPSWVFEPQGMGRYVGISDPETDSTTAHYQALSRAWVMAVIENGLELKILQDSFNRVYGDESNENLAYKYSYIAELTAQAIPTLSFSPTRECTSLYGERCVEVMLCDSTMEGSTTFASDSATFYCEYYQSGSEVYKLERDMILNLHYQVSIDGKLYSESIEILRINKRRMAHHIVNGDTLALSNNYNYNLSDMEISTFINDNKYNEPTSIVDGLFTALVESMASKIVARPDYEYKIQSLTENGSIANQGLVRMGYIGTIELSLDNFIITDQKMWGVWRIIL